MLDDSLKAALLYKPVVSMGNAAPLIQASRVNQALCDEAERGCVHGVGTFGNGTWTMPDGMTQLHLNAFYNVFGNQAIPRSPLDAIPGSEPLITHTQSPCALNGNPFWNTLFIYLRASVGTLYGVQYSDEFGLTADEYTQVTSLGKSWNLTGDWGDRNRLAESGWYQDDSALTVNGDTWCQSYTVLDALGNIQYKIEELSFPWGRLYIPVSYLKKANVIAPRRVYFPPENNIAIWYLNPFATTQPITLVFDPGIMLHCGISDAYSVGCIPGGKSAIAKTDFSTLQHRDSFVFLQEKNNKAEVEFVVSLMAHLRRNRLYSTLLYIDENKLVELPLEQLRQIASKFDCIIPPELGCEYLGDLTETIRKYKPMPLISGILDKGEVIEVQFEDNLPWNLAGYFTKGLTAGGEIFGKFGSVKASKVMTVIDRHNLGKAAKWDFDGKVQASEDISEESIFEMVLQNCQVVLIAAANFLTLDICTKFIKFCIRQNCAVIIFSDKEKPYRREYLVSQRFPVIEHNLEKRFEVFHFEMTFDDNWKRCAVQELSVDRIKQLGSLKTIPAMRNGVKTEMQYDMYDV